MGHGIQVAPPRARSPRVARRMRLPSGRLRATLEPLRELARVAALPPWQPQQRPLGLAAREELLGALLRQVADLTGARVGASPRQVVGVAAGEKPFGV